MTYNPITLKDLGSYWVSQGGVNLGVVGNKAHTKGYHLGKDRIYDGSGPGIGSDDYSVQLARDKAGLTNAASAIDLGRLDGSLTDLRKFSKWLVARCMADIKVRHEFREIIYSPDGTIVQRYSSVDNKIHTGPGNGDDSHKTHSHCSFIRDTELRNKIWLISPYFAAPIPAPGGNMSQFITYTTPKIAVVPAGTWIYDNAACAPAAGNIQVNPGRNMPVAGKEANGTHILGYVDTTPTETEVKTYWAKAGTVTLKDATSPAPPDTTPYDQADVDEADAKGYQRGLAEGHTDGEVDEKNRIAESEKERILAI
jgi:hypothetical protein